MWAAEGGYDFVAEALFGDLNVDGYFLEFDDERSGTFEPLRYVPKGKQVILGIVTTKRAELEDKDVLKRRIEEAPQFIDIDQLGISGQCGFSSTEEGNNLTIDEQKAQARADRRGRRRGLGLAGGVRQLDLPVDQPQCLAAQLRVTLVSDVAAQRDHGEAQLVVSQHGVRDRLR